MGRRRIGILAAIFAVLAAGLGCDGPTAPTTEKQAYRGELTARQTQVFGKRLTDLAEKGLVSQNDGAFRWKDVTGKPLILSAIYTNCPMEKMCPMVTSKIGDVQQRMFEKAGWKPADFRVVFVTFDPERDTPSKLREYVRSRGVSMENTAVVSGDSDTIASVMEGIEVGTKEAGDGTFTHNLRTYVVAPSGEVRFGFRKTGWRPRDVAARLKSLGD